MMIEWRNENEMTKRTRRERRTSFLLLDILLRINIKWLTFDKTLTKVSSLSHTILMTFWRTSCQICTHFALLTFNLINQSLHIQQSLKRIFRSFSSLSSKRLFLSLSSSSKRLSLLLFSSSKLLRRSNSSKESEIKSLLSTRLRATTIKNETERSRRAIQDFDSWSTRW